MSVLVDTSIWVRFLTDRAPDAAALDRLLSLEDVSGHPYVYGELLMGDRGDRTSFLAQYEFVDEAPLIPHDEVVEFVRRRRLQSRGIGWTDAHLLASALVGGLSLWTADARLAALAGELGVAHRARP